ncbi:MAG: hypothetical protein HQM11_09500 [SAR324 cluster bacterium]|nr:hypothetical protein [SAR324 cluster bacterium]
MKKTYQQFMKKIGSLLVTSMLITISGCGNEAPENKPGQASIDLGDLLKQVGIVQSQSRVNGWVDNSTNEGVDPIKTLIVAPLTHSNNLVNGVPQVYDPDAPVTDEISDNIKNDIGNTMDYISFIDLTNAEIKAQDYIEFPVPARANTSWQVVAIASKAVLKSLDDIGDNAPPEKKESVVYYGFSKKAFNSAQDLASQFEAVSIQLKRACLSDPVPKGCATYNGKKKPVVSNGVEIHSVTVTHSTGEYVTTFSTPLVVRNAPDSGQITKEDATTQLQSLVDEYKSTYGDTNIKKLTTKVTHMLNPAETTACKAGTYTSCEFQSYIYNY